MEITQHHLRLRHGMANIGPGLRLHYVMAGNGDRTAVLLHGFPQTWQEWRHVIGPLSEAGFRIVAPDYRGAGQSSRPRGGTTSAPWLKIFIIWSGITWASPAGWL
jgi:pimeloyl-ACP methyl ester carboxylesterase